jgi:hypothetical protein
MSLQFGSITFTDPVKLAQWRPTEGAGLYCICVVNQDWKPVSLQPIFFGVADNLADQDLLREQVALDSWAAHASSPSKLLVTHAHLPHFSDDQLGLFEQQLIAQYEPPCNLWERLPAFSLPEQRSADAVAKYDRMSSAATQNNWEKKYA